MTLPFINRNRQVQLYADAISAVWTWWDMVTDPSYALQQELDIWEIIQRDPKVYQGIQQRLNDVAGPNWRVFPFNNSKQKRDKIIAAIIEAMLRKLPGFADARKRLAQSVFRAHATEQILGRREMVALAETPMQNWFMPTNLRHIDPRRFVIRPVHIPRADGSFRVRGELYMSVIPAFLPPEGVELWYGRYVKVQNPHQFVRIVYDNEESRLGHGRGINDVLYFYHWAKQIVIKEGLQGLERWAQGVPVLKLDVNAKGSTAQPTDTVKQTALDNLAKMRSRHYFVIDKRDELQYMQGGGEGHQIVMGFLSYIDSCIMGVCTGAALKSSGDVGNSGAGTFASDKVGADKQSKVVQFDINKLDEDITTDLISLLVRLNRPQLKKVGELINVPGLEYADVPQFKTVQEDTTPPTEAATMFQTILQIPGVKVRKDEFYRKTGLTPPDPDDEVLEAQDPNEVPPTMDPYGGGPEPEENPSDGPEQDDDLFDEGKPEEDDDLFDGASPEDATPSETANDQKEEGD